MQGSCRTLRGMLFPSSSTTGQALGPDATPAPGPSFVRIGDVASSIASGFCAPVRQLRPIETAWIEFLKGHAWQWFGTFTYKDAVHPEAADKQFRLWSRRLDESNGIHMKKPRDSARRCIWVRGLEWQKRDVLHYHALLGNVGAFKGETCMKLAELEWLTISGGFARIDQCRDDGALQYVTKYAVKGGEVDFSANLNPPDLLAQR